MNQHDFEILMNEYLDGVATDEQTGELFRQLSFSSDYRKIFSSSLQLRRTLQQIEKEEVPESLDRRIKKIIQKKQFAVQFQSDVSPIKNFFHRKASFSTPVYVTVLALIIIGTIFLSIKFNSIINPEKTEYVYIMQLPEIEVHETIN